MNIPQDKCWRLFCANKYYYLLASTYGKVDTAIKFSAFLFMMLHWIMWGFVCAYAYIISVGLTMAMRMFQKTDSESRRRLSWFTLKARWRKYFNCREESIWHVFLLPVSRPIVVYQEYKAMVV
ncbi:unnamed protein product [Caenorhabditis sp. 36 PRJEB53466]|nr:unnamed protein product [Caenorhabditis sp. 36 PRJEB53466]